MLAAFYEKIADQRHGGASKLKSDATFFTIADGIVQHMFIEYLLAGDKFAQIVGEEDGGFGSSLPRGWHRAVASSCRSSGHLVRPEHERGGEPCG